VAGEGVWEGIGEGFSCFRGVPVAVPVVAVVMRAGGMGAGWGIEGMEGAEVSGWMGMGVFCGASRTGVALVTGALVSEGSGA